MTPTRLTIEHVSQEFVASGTKITAIDDVSLAVGAGEFVALVGPSGCGKSTLLAMLAGLRQPTRGALNYDGKPITGPAPQHIGVIFQEANLLPWLTALENVAFPLKLRGVAKHERLARAMDMLRLIGLTGFEHRLPKELSGGMKQRVSIARGLVQDPAALLLDEPFAALDEQTRLLLGDELLRLWQATGKTIVFVTHSLTEAVYLSTRVAVLSARPGRLVDDIAIDLPHPRTFALTSTVRFLSLKDRIWNHIRAAELAHA